MDFAARQRVRFCSLSRARLTIMEALDLMETLPRHLPAHLLPISRETFCSVFLQSNPCVSDWCWLLCHGICTRGSLVSQHVVEVCGWRSTTAKHPPLINRSFSSSTRQGPSCCAGLVGSRRHHCPPQATPSCVLSGAFTSSPGVTGRPLLGLCMISEGYYSTPSTCFFPPGSCSCFSYMYEFVARFCCRVWWCLHLAPTPTRCCLPCIIVSSRVPVVQIRIRARLGSDQRVLPARLPLLRVYIWLLLLACMSRPALQCVCQTCRHLHRPLWPRLNPLLVDGARVSVHGGVAKRCPPPLPCDFSAAIPELQQCY